MSWTDENLDDIHSVIAILKKHGYYWSVVFEILFSLYCIVMFVVDDWVLYHLVIALGSFVISVKTIELALAKERVDKVEGIVANLEDKLCLSEHDVARLKLELDTVQTALKDRETASDTEQKPKPKRPAFKRKPKMKTENPDENKN